MKLKEGVILTRNGEEYIVVAAGEAGKSFSGMIRLNRSAAYIAECLQEETTAEALKLRLHEKYEITEEQAATAIQLVVEKLDGAGLME